MGPVETNDVSSIAATNTVTVFSRAMETLGVVLAVVIATATREILMVTGDVATVTTMNVVGAVVTTIAAMATISLLVVSSSAVAALASIGLTIGSMPASGLAVNPISVTILTTCVVVFVTVIIGVAMTISQDCIVIVTAIDANITTKLIDCMVALNAIIIIVCHVVVRYVTTVVVGFIDMTFIVASPLVIVASVEGATSIDLVANLITIVANLTSVIAVVGLSAINDDSIDNVYKNTIG